jgi:hypothetical protein
VADRITELGITPSELDQLEEDCICEQRAFTLNTKPKKGLREIGRGEVNTERVIERSLRRG